MAAGRVNVAYQYVRQPLRAEEADALSHACETPEEKLIIWTLLDTGLRVAELCSLTPQHILWQQKAFRVLGKGGPYGKQSKLAQNERSCYQRQSSSIKLQNNDFWMAKIGCAKNPQG